MLGPCMYVSVCGPRRVAYGIRSGCPMERAATHPSITQAHKITQNLPQDKNPLDHVSFFDTFEDVSTRHVRADSVTTMQTQV